MQVICVKTPTEALWLDNGSAAFPTSFINIGSFYNVERELNFEDGVYYKLIEFDYPDVWHNSLFAIPSGIDENELVNTKEEYV